MALPKKTVLPPGPPKADWAFQQYQFDHRLDRGKPRDLQAIQLDSGNEDRGNTFYERLQRSINRRSLVRILQQK